MSLKRILVGMMAATGLFGGHAANAVQAQSSAKLVAAAKTGTQSPRSIEADMIGRYLDGMAGQYIRQGGNTPYEWGTSRQCAKMVRKNRMHRMGIAHSRI